jgi:hypothetical protein
MLVEKFDKMTKVLKDDKPPKGPSSKQILEALNEIEGLDEAKSSNCLTS